MEAIYLDYQATTPTDKKVLEAMQPYWSQEFGNPHSEGHAFGWNARKAVQSARANVANFLNAYDDEIIFVSGATESCNLALRGTVNTAKPNTRTQLVTLATEHPAVLETARFLESQDYELEILPVNKEGMLDLETLKEVISEKTLLVSVMLANNEIGVIQPLSQIAGLCHSVGAFVHTDATQAAGRIKIDVEKLQVDLLSISGHKIYGPNGIGALYIRNRPDLKVSPIMTGGHQENSIRPGTIPVPLVIGLGEACRLAEKALAEEPERLNKMTRRILTDLEENFPSLIKFGSMDNRVPGNISVGIPGIPGEALVDSVSEKLAISTGAACSTGSPDPSHVITALGFQPEDASTAIRISLGRFTSEEDVDHACRILKTAIKTLKGEQ